MAWRGVFVFFILFVASFIFSLSFVVSSNYFANSTGGAAWMEAYPSIISAQAGWGWNEIDAIQYNSSDLNLISGLDGAVNFTTSFDQTENVGHRIRINISESSPESLTLIANVSLLNVIGGGSGNRNTSFYIGNVSSTSWKLLNNTFIGQNISFYDNFTAVISSGVSDFINSTDEGNFVYLLINHFNSAAHFQFISNVSEILVITSNSEPFYTSESYGANWTMAGRYHNRTGFIGNTNYFNISNAVINSSFTCEESSSFSSVSRNVLLYNGIIYLGCDSEGIYSLNASNLSQELGFHNLTSSNSYITTMLYANDSIYFGESYSLRIGHLNASNLSQSFSNFTLSNSGVLQDYIKSITAYNQSLFFNYQDFPVYGARTYELNLSNLSQVVTNSSIQTKNFPAIFDDSIFFSATSTYFHDLNLSNIGQNLSTASSILGADYPLIIDGKILVQYTNASLDYYNASNLSQGKLDSFVPPNSPSSVFNPPVYGPGSIYLTLSNGTIYQVNSSDLSQISSYGSFSAPPISSIQPLSTDSSVFFSDSNNITQLNSTDISNFIGNYSFSNASIVYLIASGDSVYVKVSDSSASTSTLYRLTEGTFSGGDSTDPSVFLQAPANGSTVNNETVSFNATFSDNSGLSNATFFLWNSSGALITSNVNGTISGTADSINYTYALPSEGTYFWNYLVNDTSGNSVFNSTNWSVTYSVPDSFPLVDFVSPTPLNYSNSSLKSQWINFTVNESNLKSIDFNWNGTNYTLFNESLFLLFNFDNESSVGDNATRIADLSGNNYSAQFRGNADYDEGKYGSGVYFDGSSDYLALEGLSFTGSGQIHEMTACTWFKTNFSQGGNYNNNWAFLDFDRSEYFNFYITPQGLIGFSTEGASGGINDMYGTNIANDDEWHYACVVFDSNITNDKKIYLDGEIENQKDVYSAGVRLGSGTTRFGFIGDGSEATGFDGSRNNKGYYGLVDELAFWNRSLSAEEIKQGYYTNIKKHGGDYWSISVNQEISTQTYSYSACATDSLDQVNCTELRELVVDSGEPIITIESPLQKTYTNSSVDFNVSLDRSGDSCYFVLDDPQNLQNVVASYKFEGNANDLTGVHDGTVYGAVLNSSGKNGRAYQFDGQNDYIFFSDSNLINTATHQNRSISLWFKADDISGSEKQVLYEEGGSTRGLNIYLEDSKLYAGGWNRANSESNWQGTWLNTSNISSNQWHHVTLVLSGNEDVNDGALKAYIDGVKYSSGNGSQLWKHGNDINFGRSGDNTVYHDGVDNTKGEYFAGMIDEAFIINSRLSDSDVATLYNFNSANMTKFNSTYFNYTYSGLLEGAHNIKYYCNSTVGAWSSSETRYFGVDFVPPIISLNYPENYQFFSSGSGIQFNFTVEDDGDGIDTCSLYGSWAGGWHANYSVQDVNTSVLTNITRNLDDGEYIWNVYCNETTGGFDFSQQGNYTLTVDSQNPQIEVDYPLNITYTGAVNNLNYSFVEDNFASCWYTIDGGVSNVTVSCSGNVESGLVSYEGTNTWTIYINDTAGNQNFSTVTFVRNTPLFGVNVLTPENQSYGQTYIDFNVSIEVPDDDVIGDSCNYNLNSGTNVTLPPTNTSYFNQTNSSIGDGAYLASFWCNATNGQENDLERVSFAIDNTPPLVTINSPTNVSYSETNVSVNMSLNEAGYCEYSVTEGVRNYSLEYVGLYEMEFFDIRPALDPGSYTLNAYCNDTGGNLNNTVSVVFTINDTVPPAITIISPIEQTYGSASVDYTVSLNENGTVIYTIDGGVTNTSLTGNEDTFGTNFTGSSGDLSNGNYNFTVYANDTLGNQNSSSVAFTISVSDDSGDSGGGSGGGGGGSSGGACTAQTTCGAWSSCSNGIRARTCTDLCTGDTSIETTSCTISKCVSDWECTNWDTCTEGYSSRECVDLNGCGNPKPSEKLKCDVEEDCTPDIFCGEQSECFYQDSIQSIILGDINYNGVSYVSCRDKNSCTPDYTEEVSCSSDVELFFLREEICGTETLIAKNVKTNNPVTYVNLDSWDENRLSLNFVQENVLYCPLCFDSVRNGNETGIDCGGDCKPCSIQPIESRWWLWILLSLLAILICIEIYRYREDISGVYRKIFGKGLSSSNI